MERGDGGMVEGVGWRGKGEGVEEGVRSGGDRQQNTIVGFVAKTLCIKEVDIRGTFC